jgi:hypothetical protein
MDALAFSDAQQHCVLAIAAAVLHLSNLEFEKSA